MYTQDFYIDQTQGNGKLSGKKLYVPKLEEVSNLEKVELLEENTSKITFAEAGKNYFGLKSLYKTSWNDIPMYIVDNHNHVFYFWFEALKNGCICKKSMLYHIDEHADTRVPKNFLQIENDIDLQTIFQYTNSQLNVGDYIAPAERYGLIEKTIQIRGEYALQEYLKNFYSLSKSEKTYDYYNTKKDSFHFSQKNKNSLILNLDLDFFQPDLNYIDYDLKKKVVLDIAKKSSLITVATSPYFIDQKLALKVLKDIFIL